MLIAENRCAVFFVSPWHRLSAAPVPVKSGEDR
jgi:hypothetical protein